MRIYVCIKHVPDSAAKISIVDRTQIDESVTFLLNPYDENALEEALRLKGRVGRGEVVAVCVGKTDAVNTVRSALAMGADRGILVAVEGRPDSILTARALKAAIEQDGQADIVFTGKVSIDSEGFQTMFRLGHAMGLPVATNATAFSLEGAQAVVECELEAGARQVIAMPLPCIVGAGKALNKPRYPTLPDIMKARKKPVRQLAIDQLKIDPPGGATRILALKPALQQRKGIILDGPMEQAVSRLITLLSEEEKLF